uniref:Uncharacterized protein n=1 Tax=Macrostomum lignano TaxID=282301 RepID=A0A1I8FBH2_9PLAT
MSDVDHHVAVQRHSLIALLAPGRHRPTLLRWLAVTARREMLALLLPMHVSATQNGHRKARPAPSRGDCGSSSTTHLAQARPLRDVVQNSVATLAAVGAAAQILDRRRGISECPFRSCQLPVGPPQCPLDPAVPAIGRWPQEAAPAPSLAAVHCQCCTFANTRTCLSAKCAQRQRPQLQRPRARFDFIWIGQLPGARELQCGLLLLLLVYHQSHF